MLEALRDHKEVSAISLMVRKGNETLFRDHPYLERLHVLDKSLPKFRQVGRMLREIRKEKYDVTINLQRFLTTGLLTAKSGSAVRIGFNKNPMAWRYTHSIPHTIGDGRHEVERNLDLIEPLFGPWKAKPKLYPTKKDFEIVKREATYVCMAPSSVWFTKQWPKEHWIDLICRMPSNIDVLLLGGKGDHELCEEIRNERWNVENLCGKLDLLQSAALMKGATMNYVNDSAPLHLCSAMDAPVTAFFCSTVPAFGFGPLSSDSRIIETKEKLDCRPCGLHGKKACPLGHFKCGDTGLDSIDLTLLNKKADS
jgi:heptosyltransferase-2